MHASDFEMEVNAPYSLNYLIFLQNIYLNQNKDAEDWLLHPSLDSSKWGLANKEEFGSVFPEVWKETVERNFNRRFDHNGILFEQKTLFEKLFVQNDDGRQGYNESSAAFLAWWDSIAGKIAVERVIDEGTMNKVYKELACSVNTNSKNKRLIIDLLYDRPVLTDNCLSSWYIALPIENLFLKSQRSHAIELMRASCK